MMKWCVGGRDLEAMEKSSEAGQVDGEAEEEDQGPNQAGPGHGPSRGVCFRGGRPRPLYLLTQGPAWSLAHLCSGPVGRAAQP